MKVKSFLLTLVLALTSLSWAQDVQMSPKGSSQAQTEHRQQIIEMHKQEMEAMKADIEKMKSSLAQMKANILLIKDVNEMARWRNNVDMWEALLSHMERMQKDMESIAPGLIDPHHMGSPHHPSEEKTQ